MLLKLAQEKFLHNNKNKSNPMKMLRTKLIESGINSVQCLADADRTIVTTAIELAKDISEKVVIVAEDTDILVLLAALTPSNVERFLLKPARPNKPEELYSSKSLSHMASVADNILLMRHCLSNTLSRKGEIFQKIPKALRP